MTVEMRNISKRFGKTIALDNVSVSFGGKKIYGLLGNNGAGKSTLFNVITSRCFADSGGVSLDGNPLDDKSGALSNIYMLGEKNYYPEDMRVKDAIYWASVFYPDFDKKTADNLAERFQLPMKNKITNLSTGYSTVLKIVIALSTNAPILLLDEPVLGLDARHRDAFYKLLLERYNENPCTIVISTHIISEVASMVEHCVIIKDGRVIKDSPCEDLLSNGYSVSGTSVMVDEYLTRVQDVIYANNMGGLKTACVSGVMPDKNAMPEGLAFGKLNLQEYFIHLMNDGAFDSKSQGWERLQ